MIIVSILIAYFNLTRTNVTTLMPGINLLDRNGAPECPKIEELDILLQNIFAVYFNILLQTFSTKLN